MRLELSSSLYLRAQGGRVLWLVIAEGQLDFVINDGERVPLGELCIPVPREEPLPDVTEEQIATIKSAIDGWKADKR